MKQKIQILMILALLAVSVVSTMAAEETPIVIIAEEGFSSNAQALVETVNSCTYYCSWCPSTGYSCNAEAICC